MRRIGIVALGLGLTIGVTAAGPAMGEDLPSGQFEQTIVLAHIPDTPVHQAVTVDASATSLLDVDITVSGSCTLQQLAGGAVIVATGPGACTVTANQPGDDRWLPAPQAQVSFSFVGGESSVRMAIDGPEMLIAAQGLPLVIPILVLPAEPGDVTPTGMVTVTPTGIPGGPICDTCEPVFAPLSDGRATITIPGATTDTWVAGAYALTVDYSGDDRYASQRLVSTAVRIVPPGVTLPGTDPIVVSIGDSYISGEAGRWAGNAFGADEAWRTDTGSTTYLDAGGVAESVPYCHRASSSEIHIEQAGADVVSVNLACSGAQTGTHSYGPHYLFAPSFKPGLDFFQDEANALRSQTLDLYRLASANPGRIRMVVMSIGGNDFQFSSIVKTCLGQYLFSVSRTPCSKLDEVTGLFTPENVRLQQANISQAILNMDNAMTEAGYTSKDWTLLVQDYPSPVPGEANRIRYGQGPLSGRQTTGGCGLFDVDLAYANNVALATINRTVRRAGQATELPNIAYLDLMDAYVGNRLCEKGVDLVGANNDVERWTDPGAMLGTEWVAPIRLASVDPYFYQESLHPNHWGQLANQVCVKLAWNDGEVRGGTCVRGDGAYDPNPLTDRAYPVMVLLPD